MQTIDGTPRARSAYRPRADARSSAAAVGGADLEPDRPAAKPERLDRALQLRGVRAASQPRVQPGAIEDGALVDVVAQLAQRHRDAGLAAEVGLLADVRHAGDHARAVGGGGVAFRPAASRPERSDQHREPDQRPRPRRLMLRLLVQRDSARGDARFPNIYSVRTSRARRPRARDAATRIR